MQTEDTLFDCGFLLKLLNNGVLRKMPFHGIYAAERTKQEIDQKNKEIESKMRHKGEPEEAPTNLFTTSILVLVSAVLKLARKSKVPAGGRVYRGFGKGLGPEWQADQRGSICKVDLAFISTTTNREVALEKSGVKDNDLGSLFEFEVGAVDCGARLETLSQYPGLFIPAANHSLAQTVIISDEASANAPVY